MKTVEVDGNILAVNRIVVVSKIYDGGADPWFDVSMDAGSYETTTINISSESKAQVEQWHNKIKIAMETAL